MEPAAASHGEAPLQLQQVHRPQRDEADVRLSLSASQNLEMSENLDEGDDFKNLLSEALSKVTTHSSTANNSLGSLQDAEGSSRPSSSSLMESGWMTGPVNSSAGKAAQVYCMTQLQLSLPPFPSYVHSLFVHTATYLLSAANFDNHTTLIFTTSMN